MFKSIALTLTASTALISTAASAHFQLLYTPELLHDRGGNVRFDMPFTHPADSGTVMTVDQPEAFYVIKKGKKTDLIETVKPAKWQSAENLGESYEADYSLRGMGDYVFIYEMAPYFEASEDMYIQQITKSIVNVGSLPTDWNEDLGLKAEIVPLTKPYAIYEGGTFTGVVKSEGKPVPFAQVEIEYVNYRPDTEANAFAKEPSIHIPADAFVTMTMYADANGTFTFGIPKAGQWGFAALGVGPDKEYKGKELSQDAVIWVQAVPAQ